jgi:hypothetical protein
VISDGERRRVHKIVQQQAMLLSFIDVFRWCGLITISCAGLAWRFRKAVHHDHGVSSSE